MKLLVAVDASAQSLQAARYALRLCEAGLKAEIVLATVSASRCVGHAAEEAGYGLAVRMGSRQSNRSRQSDRRCPCWPCGA